MLSGLDERRLREQLYRLFAIEPVEAERAERVRGAVAQLPDKQRAALVLRVYEDMTHQEIAETLGTSVGAAKANVFHALRNLKRLLGGEAV